MGTIAENLLKLQQTKENFKTAFAEKEVDLTDVPFTEYPNKLDELKENLDTELTAQETLLEELDTQVNELSDKPKDMLQQMVDVNKSCYNLFNQYKGDNLDFIKDLDTSNVTEMSDMFRYAKVVNLDNIILNTEQVTKMTEMFQYCEKLKTIPKFSDTSKVTSMERMFQECKVIETLDLSDFNTSSVTTMTEMFSGCRLLSTLDISNFNTSQVRRMNHMFYDCRVLTSLDLSHFDTGTVQEMQNMFYDCFGLTNLNLSSFNTSNVTSMQSMFYGCKALTSLDLSGFNTSQVKSIQSMFYNCVLLESVNISNFDTSLVTSTTQMFYGCEKLVNVIGIIDMINATSVGSMFDNCKSLESINLKNIKKALRFYQSEKLTNETVINIVKELWDLTGSTSQTLTLTSAVKNNIANIYVKLVDVTDEMLAQDQYAGNKKPCVVCESTDEGAMTLTEYATSKNWAIA